MPRISKNKLKKIKREYTHKSVQEIALQLGISEREVEEAIRGFREEKEPSKRASDDVRAIERVPRKWLITSAVVSVLFTALCFGSSLRYPMLFDDHHSIADNHYIRSLKNIPAFFVHPEMFSNEPGRKMFRPLVSASYAINYAISELDTASYHLVNYLFHALNGLLIFSLLWRIFRSPPLAFLLSLLFIANPVCTESVVYLSARSTVMASSFLFASLYFFLCYMEDPRKTNLFVSVILFICGLLCKENLIMLPAIVFVCGELFEKSSPRILPSKTSHSKKRSFLGRFGNTFFQKRLSREYPFWLVALVYLLVRRFLLNLSSVVVSRNDRTFPEQVLTQMGVWLEYLVKIFLPVGLNNQEHFPIAKTLWASGVGLAGQPLVWAMLWVLVFWLVYSLRSKKEFLMGVFFAVLILLPETITAMNQLYNERRIYMPLFGVLLAVGAMSEQLSRGRIKVGIAVVCLILMSIMSVARTRVWHDEKALWFDSIRKSPNSEVNWHGLGYIYGQEGKDGKALWALKKALDNNPSYAPSLRLYGAILLKQDKAREALLYLDRATKIEKYSHKGWYNLGLALYKVGEVGKAEIAFKNAIALNQFYPLPHYMLAKVYWERGDERGALKEIEEAIRRDPQNKLYLKYRDYILGKERRGDEATGEGVE